MKSYHTKNTFRIVGKAWQVGILLRQWQQEHDPGVLVVDMLAQKRVQA